MNRLPWNRGRAVGPRTAFTAGQCRQVVETLSVRRRWRDTALFMLGIDSMLRLSDLASLTVADVRDATGVMTCIRWRQKKTSQSVFPALTPDTRDAVERWINHSQKRPTDFLFTAEGGMQPLHASSFRRLIKQWAHWIGLDPRHYSGHSLRRTKPLHLYDCGVPIERISKLLGHRSIETTLIYLDIRLAEAQADSLKFDLFRPERRRKSPKPASHRLSDADIERIAAAVARNLRKE